MFIDRSKRDWERILTDLLTLSNGSVFLAEENDSCVGYALVYPKGDILEATEICGNIHIDMSPVPAPPVMARIINAKGILESLSKNELSDLCITDDFIPQNNINSKYSQRIDIAELTERIFDDCFSSGYINLLL